MSFPLTMSHPAFIVPFSASTRRLQSRWTCTHNPTEPQVPSKDLSSVDRQYLAKIKKKFLASRKAVKSVKGNQTEEESDADALFTASLPDNLDEIDNIIFDRGPKNENQVRLFGAWLDDSVAGRKARDRNVRTAAENAGLVEDEEIENDFLLTREEMTELANDIFADAMDDFNKGKYKPAVTKYQRAVSLVGEDSRLGGQYQLWHAQALDASGDKKEAAKLLKGLRVHADSDVRKVSSELLFIMTAPKLEFEPDSFFSIPSLEDAPSSGRLSTVLTSSYGPLKTALVEKQPERYSLEWYLKKERPPKSSDNTTVEFLLVVASVLVTLAYMYTNSPS